MSEALDNERFRKLLLSSPGIAIEILYHQYSRTLQKIAVYLTKDTAVADDIVEDSFIHIWENHKKLGQFHERSIFHYLVKVVKYKSISHYKASNSLAEKKAKYVSHRQVNLLVPSAETTMIETETRQEIRDIISRFPARERECLFMKLDEDLTVKQIAEKLGVTPKAVERSITSANKRLRSLWRSGPKKT